MNERTASIAALVTSLLQAETERGDQHDHRPDDLEQLPGEPIDAVPEHPETDADQGKVPAHLDDPQQHEDQHDHKHGSKPDVAVMAKAVAEAVDPATEPADQQDHQNHYENCTHVRSPLRSLAYVGSAETAYTRFACWLNTGTRAANLNAIISCSVALVALIFKLARP